MPPVLSELLSWVAMGERGRSFIAARNTQLFRARLRLLAWRPLPPLPRPLLPLPGGRGDELANNILTLVQNYISRASASQGHTSKRCKALEAVVELADLHSSTEEAM